MKGYFSTFVNAHQGGTFMKPKIQRGLALFVSLGIVCSVLWFGVNNACAAMKTMGIRPHAAMISENEALSEIGGEATIVPNPLGLTVYDVNPLFSSICEGAPVDQCDNNDTSTNQMPDQQTPILLDRNTRTYLLFVTGVQGDDGGVTNLIRTNDIMNPNAYSLVDTVLQGECSCKKASSKPCVSYPPSGNDDYLATYTGMLSVFRTNKCPNELVGFYIADQKSFLDTMECPKDTGRFYAEVYSAYSHDGGKTWKKDHIPVLSGERMPDTTPPGAGPVGLNQPTFIQADDYLYAYLDYYSPGNGFQGYQVARSRIDKRTGKPGSWFKLYHGTFNSGQPGVDGLGDIVLKYPAYEANTDNDNSKPVNMGMAWISYNTYLHKYLMTFVAKDGWYYSTLGKQDMDTQNWSAPVPFLRTPGLGNWVHGSPTWENMVFVTPGEESNHVTGKEGLVIFSAMGCWSGCTDGRKMGRYFVVARYNFTRHFCDKQ